MADARLAAVGALDAADAEEFLATAPEISFDRFHRCGRHHEDHSDAHVERLEQFVGLDFPKSSQVFENRRNRPRGEIDLRLDAGGKHTG